jgi:galactokinase
MVDPNILAAKFKKQFGAAPQIYRAPGRVNLIGDHTDYNDGFVLPAAIDFSCYAAISTRTDNQLVLFSENLEETITVSLDKPIKSSSQWTDYPLGVFLQLQNAGFTLGGANLYIFSEVPIGAGLSSSAALEVSAAYALLGAFGHTADPLQVAKLCQQAENEFVGAKCGIMDQFVACHGLADHALLLDCRSFQFRTIRIPDSLRIVICNTMVEHKLVAEQNGYNTRRAECDEAVHLLAQTMPQIHSLRDLSLSELENHRNLLPGVLYKRCRHVVTENQRVEQMADALPRNDLKQVRKLMFDSHRSLRDDYEVSCPELDLMVALAEQQRGVHGARMTGAGFGGCTVNLVEETHVEAFRRRIAEQYSAKTGHTPEIYVCKAVAGAARVL